MTDADLIREARGRFVQTLNSYNNAVSLTACGARGAYLDVEKLGGELFKFVTDLAAALEERGAQLERANVENKRLHDLHLERTKFTTTQIDRALAAEARADRLAEQKAAKLAAAIMAAHKEWSDEE